MKKYLLISHKFLDTKRGAHTTSQRLMNEFPDYLDHLNDLDSQNLEELNEEYKRIIFITQAPHMYHIKMNYSRLKAINPIIFLRGDKNPILYESCNNGFYYYKTYKNIKYYIPFITDFNPYKQKSHLKPCIGFYIRRFLVPDSHLRCIDFLKNLKHEVNVVTMGNNIPEIKSIPNVKSYKHTYDNKEFFSNISHYVYPASKKFQDPFPNTVLEAIQSNKQIIFLDIPNRNHVDGIDDIKDCIKWHKDFNPDLNYDNSNCILKFNNFKKFYIDLFNNNFEYSFDREKYKVFNEWIESEIL